MSRSMRERVTLAGTMRADRIAALLNASMRGRFNAGQKVAVARLAQGFFNTRARTLWRVTFDRDDSHGWRFVCWVLKNAQTVETP